MAVAVQMPGFGQGLGGSRALKLGLGVLSGGAAAPAMGISPLAGMLGGGLLANSNAGAALGAAKALFGGGDGSIDARPIEGSEQLLENPLERRLYAMESDSRALMHQALEALRHPDMPPEYVQAFAEPLLRLKHYGAHDGGVA